MPKKINFTIANLDRVTCPPDGRSMTTVINNGKIISVADARRMVARTSTTARRRGFSSAKRQPALRRFTSTGACRDGRRASALARIRR